MKTDISDFAKNEMLANRNVQYAENFGTHHLHVFLARGAGKHNRSSGIIDYQETYAFEFYSNVLSSGGLVTDTLDHMSNQVDRIFMRYPTNYIAGISMIDNLVIGETIPPESDNNPFLGVFKRTVFIDIFYTVNFKYELETWAINEDVARYSAGSFKEALNDDVFIDPRKP